MAFSSSRPITSSIRSKGRSPLRTKTSRRIASGGFFRLIRTTFAVASGVGALTIGADQQHSGYLNATSIGDTDVVATLGETALPVGGSMYIGVLARHTAGDREAFGELVARHRDRLWRVALRTLGDPDDAADAVQDALVSAYRSAATYRGDAAVTTWLHRITVNACIDLARRRASRPTTTLTEDNAREAQTVDGTYDASDAAASVVAALRRLLRWLPVNTVRTRQRIADFLVEAGRYSL